jgi:hypothetical protein
MERLKDLGFHDERAAKIRNAPSSRMDALYQLLLDILRRTKDERIVVFFEYRTGLLDHDGVIQQMMARIKGEIGNFDNEYDIPDPGADMRRAVARFQDRRLRVLFLTYASGSVGINLQDRQYDSHVILVTPSETYTVESQAIARVARVGAAKPVHVHEIRLQLPAAAPPGKLSLDECIAQTRDAKQHQWDIFAREGAIAAQPRRKVGGIFTGESIQDAILAMFSERGV